MIRRTLRTALALALLSFGAGPWLSSSARAGADEAPPPAPTSPAVPAPAPRAEGRSSKPARPTPPPPPPQWPPLPTVVHLPTEEIDILVRAQGRAVLLRYDEYRALLDASRAKEGEPGAAPPEDVVRLSGEGTLDLTDDAAARFRVVYRIQSLAPGPRSVGFDAGGVAFERVQVEPEGSAGPGRYESRDGRGRLYLDGPGVRRVTVEGSAVPAREGDGRRIDLWLPNPAAMALAVTLPQGVAATIEGEGVPLVVQSPADKPVTVVTRPTRGGHLVLTWVSSAHGTDGPGVLDTDLKTLYTVGEGAVSVRALVRVDVLRTPTDALVLEVPADLAVHGVEGPGVMGFARSEDRLRLTVNREKAALGRLELLLQGERPYKAGLGVEMPRIRVAGAIRQQGEAALRFGPDVNARAVHVTGGRRMSERSTDPATAGVLRYALFGPDAVLTVDIEPGALRVDATSTYYLNLAEPGQTLFASVTYRVVEGILFRMSPRFPREYDLKEMTVNGGAGGFTRDVTPDGRVEITLGKGVPVGGDVVLLATLERARADWVPEKGHVQVPFAVPSAGATREDGYVAVGADAGFEVLDAGVKDLVAVGAADLTARGLSASGLVYGYRIDGPAPSVTLDVSRREPLVEADVVTVLHPGPRRVDFAAQVVYRIQRAGVRRLYLDVPSWAGDQVDVRTPFLRNATRLVGDRRPADVPEGYDRWQVDLEQRAIGTHVVTALWFLDRDADDWTIEADRRLAARVPLERAERLLVVRRSVGLEVSVPRLGTMPDVRMLDMTEVPVEAMVDAQSVLEVLRLPAGRDGVQVDVRKHAGAAVLGAIATEVSIRTAVSREGVLRTRADVTLVNIDRQFVDVALPGDSTLIGAVVDGIPVKPLVRPEGTLLLTVPSTISGGPSRRSLVHVALTYETRLGERVKGRVRVEAPRFPGLEVLHTTQEVGVEPELAITAVAGDLLASAPVVRPTRTPWMAWPLVGLSKMSASAVAEREMKMAVPTSSATSSPDGEVSGYGVAGKRPQDKPEPTPSPAPGAVPPVPPPAPGMEDVDRESAAPVMDGPVARGGPVPAGEPPTGGTPEGKPGAPDGRRLGTARKGQLSLDVPVFLAPNRVVASRIGGGGALVLDLVSKEGSDRAYLFLGVAVLTVGLCIVALGWLSGWLVVLAGLAVALILQLSFGAAASTLVAGVADGSTLLGLLLVLRWFFTRRAARAPRPAAATAMAALLTLAGAFAAPAYAEDAPSPVPAPGAGTVFVPQDAAHGGGLAPDDRVFVPLATWLELERKAHPERDPELAALGQVVTLVEASYRLDVGASNAQGTARFVLALRGRGTQLVALPLAGLAVTEARLDGQPVRLLLDGGLYRIPLEREGDHVLELSIQAPVLAQPGGRSFTFTAPTFAATTLDVSAASFDGDLLVSGAGRVVVLTKPEEGEGFTARAYLGRPTGSGAEQQVTVSLAERGPKALLAAVKTRAESRVVHSVRDGGTESIAVVDVHVLQGKAPFVELAVPAGVDVLEASGAQVKHWETGPGRLRLVLIQPTEGKVTVRVRTFHPAASPERREALPELSVLDTTGESGLVVVNGDPSFRLEAEPGTGLFRTARPSDADAAGSDGQGRVLGAWRFAARPAALAARVERAQARLELTSVVRATFGDERLRTVLEGRVRVQRAPVGDLVFALPGVDEVRAVEGPGIQTWWLDGQGETRRLFVRMGDLFEGDRPLTVRLERRLGGTRQGVSVPRWSLADARIDQGVLLLFALPDVEPAPAPSPGWKALPPMRLDGQEPNVVGARATHAFEWDAVPSGALTVALRIPEQEIEAVVVSQVSPSDEEQRLEHLVVFDVRRGAAMSLSLFVPDGGRGLAVNDVVRARDVRELRFEPAVRTDADGREIQGRLYTLRLQSAKSGLIEVTVSQLWPARSIVHVVRPEGVKATRWFALVRTFLDGEVDVRVVAGAPDPAEWADLPFLPTGLSRTSVLRTYAARAPYLLEVIARRHRIETQADAVVLSAKAEVVVGLDGEARVRVRYRLFNRARQFLALRLPDGAVLYGAVAAGRPVKPLAGENGGILLPVPKVPLGGAGYEVSIMYRARVGAGLEKGGSATLLLPQVLGVEVDRTVVTLRVPAGFDYDFDTKMTSASEAEALGDEVEASLREAQEVLKVAETGTLEQRMYACTNSSPLVDEARARLAQYQQQGAKGDRVAALRAELDKLAQIQAETSGRCEVDAVVAKNKAQFEANETFSANANGQTLVVLDGQGDGVAAGTESRAVRDAETLASGANWRFNDERVSAEQAGKKDIAELKGRMQSELQRRGDEERRKSVDVVEVEKSRSAASRVTAKESAKQEAGADDATARYDENRNNFFLNDQIRRVQAVQRQLGTDAGEGGGRAWKAGLGGTSTQRAVPEEFGQHSEAVDTHVGLMGVDVPLPKEGRLFWFVAARAGSALEIDASPVATSTWKRALLSLALLGALGFALVRIARRRVAALD